MYFSANRSLNKICTIYKARVKLYTARFNNIYRSKRVRLCPPLNHVTLQPHNFRYLAHKHEAAKDIPIHNQPRIAITG